jgi:enoyl-[acyl-carrier protein] reductase III
VGGCFSEHDWALILGGSSGSGLAAARKLAAHGVNLATVVHLPSPDDAARMRSALIAVDDGEDVAGI